MPVTSTRGCSRDRSVSRSVPHQPHDEVVVVSRAAGTGACPPVSTVTMLKAVSVAVPVAQ